MDTPKSAMWELANLRCGGTLAQKIADLRAQGQSWVEISIALMEPTGMRISYETLRGWAKQLGITQQEPAA
jgi:hypothetical protein